MLKKKGSVVMKIGWVLIHYLFKNRPKMDHSGMGLPGIFLKTQSKHGQG
jgi:hypothetical protein